MKLPMPTQDEIYKMATRAEGAINESRSRAANIHIIENAIRDALQRVVDRMNIQVPDVMHLDLSKQQ